MKKLIKIIVIPFFLYLFLASCTSDEVFDFNEKSLIGVWHEDFFIMEKSQTFRLKFTFNVDNTYEIFHKFIDNSNEEVLGFRYKELGNYNLRGNKLFFNDIKRYRNNDNQTEFTTIENLVLVNPDFENSSSSIITFKNNQSKLIFVDPPCNDTAACLALPKLERQ